MNLILYMTLYISGKGGIDDSISQPSGSAYKELYAKQQKQLKVDKQRNQNDKLNEEKKHKNNEFDNDEYMKIMTKLTMVMMMTMN